MDYFQKLRGKLKLSDAAILTGEGFDDNSDKLEFLDLVIARCENFDESNRFPGTKTFSDDISYLIECAIASLTSQNSNKFENRIDSYFYIYRRLEEYSAMRRGSYFSSKPSTALDSFRKQLYEKLSLTFLTSKGAEPDLYVTDRQLLERMNIYQHFSSITIINTQTLAIFFTLCKLSMKSSLVLDTDRNRLKWLDVLSKVKDINLTLIDFIKRYLGYKQAFTQFPLDVPAFIYLIEKLHPSKPYEKSPFIIFISLYRELKFPDAEFFALFQPLFIKGIQNGRYDIQQISILLRLLSLNDHLFSVYLSIYSTHMSTSDLWKMYLNLSKLCDPGGLNKKCLIPVLTKCFSTVSVRTFREYTESARVCLTELKVESRPQFTEIFEKIYDNFIIKQLQDPQYSYQFTESDMRDFLKFGILLSTTHSIKRPSCLLLVRELLFKIDNRISNTAEKIKRLFENLKQFDENLCKNLDPSEIIEDDWLKDFLINNIQVWSKLDEDIYRYLCNTYENNRWTIYIWSRIIHLSLLKLTNDNPNEILLKLNDWMKKIKHDIYEPTDDLTCIFIAKLFNLIIARHARSILSLPNIRTIMNFVIAIKEHPSYTTDLAQVNTVIQNGVEILHEILQLKGTCSSYRDLSKGSILYCFLPLIDLKKILKPANPQQYKFPLTTANIDSIVSLPRPKDIDIADIESDVDFFNRFIHQIHEWFQWFDRFIDIFQHIIEWLKDYNVNKANQLFIDLYTIRDDPKITVNYVKTIIENISNLLKSFNDLRRLCHLFNCLTSFQIIDPGTLNTQDNVLKYIGDLKRFHPNNTFTVENRKSYEYKVPILDRQQVQWSLASENHPCNIEIEYQINESNDKKEILFQKDNIQINKHVLYGQFETQRNGQLIITINNKQTNNSRILWYRIRSIGLSRCHLFDGIFKMLYQKYYDQPIQIRENELSELLVRVFVFIDNLLNGSLSLRDMTDLRSVFYDKNINIREEVKKLYTNRSVEKLPDKQATTNLIPDDREIEQICEWLQIYQYYSHINIIIECIEKFDILSIDNEDETIGSLRRLSGNENCSLKEITQAYKILQQRFQSLTHQHLQLIKTVVECSNVIHMMKKSDLYSDHGLRRFQELKDNLTTQFQLQERNNMILNSWIMTYKLVEPFIHKAKNFDDFLSRLAQLSNLEESSLNHIKIVNDNMQIVNMWLSAEATSVVDNALITMEQLFKSGTVDIHLQHLMNEQSYFEIGYSIDRIQGQTQRVTDEIKPEGFHEELEKIKFTLSMTDIDDHKRQLTFCNVDVQQNVFYKKALINGQLKLIQTIEKIYSILHKLEMAGHPDYQLTNNHYEIHLQLTQNNSILNELRNHQNIRLENAIKDRTDKLQIFYTTFQTAYNIWILNLKKYREEFSLLKLFSNRQIMIFIILLRTSLAENSIKIRFLKKLFSFKDLNNQNNEEKKLTILCLIHYLRSLKINQCDLSDNHISNLYTTYQIDPGANTDLCLEKLSQFLRELFHNGQELFEIKKMDNESQQYLVTVNSIEHTPNQISFEHDLDMNTCCILLNIFNDKLPSSYQILWCTNATDEDIHLFFSRIRTFRYLIFVIMDIDKMHHRLRELLLNEQDSLTREQQPHGTVYYFSRELTTGRKGLREFQIPSRYRNPNQTYTELMKLFKNSNITPPHIQIIYGLAGIGKTHRIKTQYKHEDISCFSINDKLNLPLLISSFLLFDSNTINNNPSIYFNISIHAPFEALNRTLFSLFICGSLNDTSSGLIFSLPFTKPWKFIIEIPYSDISPLTIKENFNQILPLLSIISSSTLEEVTGDNYQLYIGDEEELVARFLKAYENKTIDCVAKPDKTGVDQPISFDKLVNHDECRTHIYNCINKYASELPKNKIYQLSFTKFLYRRIRFFIGHFYCWNQNNQQLGSIAMKQMINEAKSLSHINFEDNNYPRVYLVYDPGFSLHLLHSDWNHVSNDLKGLFGNHDPLKSIEYKNKDYFAECLAWLLNIRYDTFMKVINETKFILTENFAYKLFHVHERKLTKLALIIEGDTGVGKTFLLKFYSLLLNSKLSDDQLEDKIIPRIIENSSLFLEKIISDKVETEANLLNTFLLRIKPKILDLENDINPIPVLPVAGPTDAEFLKEIKLSLKTYKYNENILYSIWKTILTISNENGMTNITTLIEALHAYVTTELINYPLIEGSSELKNLLQQTFSPTIEISIGIFKEYLFHSQRKPLFYRLLIHPGITEEQLVEFMSPISQLARELTNIEVVVFFDELNTSSCLGLFKEIFMDGTLHGSSIPKNIFFTAAINPLIKIEENGQVHRRDFLVHDLPQSLKDLKVSYGSLKLETLGDYIVRKIAMFQVNSSTISGESMPLEQYTQVTLANAILEAQGFCETRLGRNSVSQREIQRCFNLIEFFWKMRYDDEIGYGQSSYHPNPVRCIALSIALIYYFRLPTREDNLQRNDSQTPSREDLAEALKHTIQNFDLVIQNELERFVNTDNFVIPQGVAINQAVREHIFQLFIVTRTPLCIIGVPGQSKTLSFQIVLQNLQGTQLSLKPFCKRLPAVDPFFCLGSKYTRSEDIASIFDRAIKREQQYEQNRMNTRCVVFLDEASLPDEKKMVLKVLHPYLDECKVSFVAIANKSFDAANANRMICVYRSLPSEDDQKILAYGCLGLQTSPGQRTIHNRLEMIISGLCQGYRGILQSPDIPHIFHDRDFIYMLRELRFELININENQEGTIGEITVRSLFRALEDNFNGINNDEFEKLIDIVFTAVTKDLPDFRLSTSEKQKIQRDIPTIFRESMKLDSTRRRLYGRYKLIIDESEDESAIRLLFQTGILDPDPNRTAVFRMPDFADDIDNELRNVEILSTIKLCMETGKTILMVNTGRIHGSLYDVFNQNFSIMATDETRKIFSKVTIGPKTIDVVVHEDFQCIVHIKRSEFKDIPPPFLSRFQKYSLSVTDFYYIQLKQLPQNEQKIMTSIEKKLRSFINHFGKQYFYGLDINTLYSCFLSLIKRNQNGEYYLSNIQQIYTQLTIKSKSFIEQNPNDIDRCYLLSIMSKLLQLVSPEAMIYKLPTIEGKLARSLCNNYFYQQEHFNIENFIRQLISTPAIEVDNSELFTTTDNFQEKLNNIIITKKVMIFTRTSSFVVGLNKQSKQDFFSSIDDEEYMNIGEKTDVLNLAIIENSVELQEQFQNYEQDNNKRVLIIVIDGRIGQQRLHIPFVRQLIDKTDNSYHTANQTIDKFFIILVHSSGQELDHHSCFPSIFLHDWDYHFLDTCTPGSAFHLQKMLQIFTLSFGNQEKQEQETFDNNLCDFDILFDDCLWDFCSRIQIFVHELPENMFKNKFAYEFYQRQTSTIRRVECLKKILQQSTQLQTRIITIYHENISMNKEILKKNCSSVYQISKDILCGKRFTSLVDSLQSDIRISFANFVSNILKFIVNDYGLETLSKLSGVRYGCDSLLNLIDYSSFITDNNDQNSPKTQAIFQLNNHNSSIPQTPLYHLFHQRIKSLADDIKLTLIHDKDQYQEGEDDLRLDYYAEPPPTTFNNNELTDHTSQKFRSELTRSILNDRILTKIISQPILESYTNDSVRTLCTIIENNFNNNLNQCQKTIEFVSNWLLLVDDNDKILLDASPNRHVWLLAHVYTSFEYDQNDVFSLYSACRITELLDQEQLFYTDLLNNNQITRSKVRENLFRLMFDQLWKSLCNLCSTDDNIEQWIHSYTFISKYYPSDKVLQRMQLVHVKGQIEFMKLAYLIFLNEKTPEPKELILQLLKYTSLINDDIDGRNVNFEASVCLSLLPIIINTIHQYFENKKVNNSTLMIDIQQWIISTLKTSKNSCREEIIFLLKFLNQSTCRLSLPMKQFLFDELVNIHFDFTRQNRIGINKQNTDFWDRINLLPIIIECIADEDLQYYQLPYHPSVITNDNKKQTLIDLFFFHLRRLVNDEIIKCEIINKILLATLPPINDRRLVPSAEIIFKQLKDYFLLQATALLLCQTDLDKYDQQRIDRIIIAIINGYLLIEPEPVKLTKNCELFLSIIITKRSWNYLLNLLKSERFQRLNAQWAKTFHSLLELKQTIQRNKYLQLCHQLQFTLTINNTSSIFPTLHQPYNELNKIVDKCVKNNDQQQRWKELSDWIQLKSTSNPPVLNLTEIKVMLLLNIYYNYYCNNQLPSLDNLLTVIENTLQPLPEELRVFRAFLQPEQYMIGYPRGDNNADTNYLNNLFKLDCQEEEELNIRHSLVNLLAMIILGGKQGFLWTFTFETLKLEHTHGFGSTANAVILTNGVHYDCGCVLTQNGDLMQFSGNAVINSLNVPAVYVAFFSTFGAFAWHLLLFDTSVQNLYGPILAKHAIDDSDVVTRIAGNNLRAKVCHFVRARLVSSYFYLSIRSNQEDACIILNRCFEQMAQLTLQTEQNPWIKPVYTELDGKFKAQQEYQTKVFYSIYEQLAEYKKFLNSLNCQSQIEKNLQDYVSQMPILIHFIHFKTELCNPKYSHLSLNILRYILNSFDFLKITQLIYDLSQFYLLLHRTYTQLIEREEFSTVTLNELYERGQKSIKNSNRFRYPNQNNKHLSIIQNGIKAVNIYHQFADGLIRPGACDETQRFTKITIDTPIDYLVTTENHDEGDIIMRILSVLVDYHNNLLDLMEKEIEKNDENNCIGLFKNLINELTSREISILQVAQENTGVITLNNNDCLWIEQLSRASLENEEEYFPKLDTQLNFNFLYVQSYIIRSYLLLCRINYRHIQQKYQCYLQLNINHTTDDSITNQNDTTFNTTDSSEFEYDWNDLKEMNLDKLSNGYNFLRHITVLLKNHSEDLSSKNLYEFVLIIDNDNKFHQQIEQYEIKDFPLSHINYVCQLYEKTINNFHHSFNNVSHLLRIPIENQLDEQVNIKLNTRFLQSSDNIDKEKLQINIKTITDFLNDLKEYENFLLGQSSLSLAETCGHLGIDNVILLLIPEEIKCKNYVSLAIKLTEIRSKLQEQTIDIEEKDIKLWDENNGVQSPEQDSPNNPFQLLKNPNLDIKPNKPDDPNLFGYGNDSDPFGIGAGPNPFGIGAGPDPFEIGDGSDPFGIGVGPVPDPIVNSSRSASPIFDQKIDYTSLFELTIKSIPLTSSILFDQIRNIESPISTKATRFTIIHSNGTLEKHLCRVEKLYELLNRVFQEKNYDINTFVIIDQNQLFVDFTNTSNKVPSYTSSEYRIIEKTSLISVILDFQQDQIEYLATTQCQISFIINQFIIDRQLKFPSPDTYLSLFDKLGKYIQTDSPISDIYRSDKEDSIHIKIKNNSDTLCEITIRPEQDKQQMTEFFDPKTKWGQIDLWLRTTDILKNIPVDTYNFWHKEQKNIIDEDQSISFTLDQSESITIDGINGQDVMKCILSYEQNQQRIRILKSCPTYCLLQNQNCLQQLNLTIPSTDCILVVIGEIDNKILNKEDLQHPIGTYSSMDKQLTHFQISILIQIIKFDDKKEFPIPISNRNLTIKELIQLTNTDNTKYKYLALNNTNMILSNDEILSNLTETKFLLVKDNETCLISIEQSKDLLVQLDNDNTIYQRYTINAKINDVYKQNKNIDQYQYLLFENDFIPSKDILLKSFLQKNLPIQFILTNHQNFQANITVINDEQKNSVKFYCSPSISIGRVSQIACLLFNINNHFYRLILSDDTNIEDDYSIDDIGESMDDIQFKLISTANVKCQVTYEEKTIIIPANNQTLVSTILGEVLEKLFIENKDINMYQLYLTDNDGAIKMDLDLSMEDILSDLPENSTIIPFQLQNK